MFWGLLLLGAAAGLDQVRAGATAFIGTVAAGIGRVPACRGDQQARMTRARARKRCKGLEDHHVRGGRHSGVAWP